VEIVREAEEEIARSAWLARVADNATRKGHQGWQDDSGGSEGEAEDGVAFGDTTPCSTGNDRLVDNDSGTDLGHSMKNSTRLSGRVSRFTARVTPRVTENLN
jgi:hypothetical protein